MIIKIEMQSEIPIYVQLRNEIVLGIGRGELKAGEVLPTVRQMAEDIGVNTMTVNKAYQILKQEGYIETDRRRGSIVSTQVLLKQEFRKKAEQELLLLIAEASIQGIKQEEFLQLCQQIYQEMQPVC